MDTLWTPFIADYSRSSFPAMYVITIKKTANPRVTHREFPNDTIPCVTCAADVQLLSAQYSRFSRLLAPYRRAVPMKLP